MGRLTCRNHCARVSPIVHPRSARGSTLRRVSVNRPPSPCDLAGTPLVGSRMTGGGDRVGPHPVWQGFGWWRAWPGVMGRVVPKFQRPVEIEKGEKRGKRKEEGSAEALAPSFGTINRQLQGTKTHYYKLVSGGFEHSMASAVAASSRSKRPPTLVHHSKFKLIKCVQTKSYHAGVTLTAKNG